MKNAQRARGSDPGLTNPRFDAVTLGPPEGGGEFAPTPNLFRSFILLQGHDGILIHRGAHFIRISSALPLYAPH